MLLLFNLLLYIKYIQILFINNILALYNDYNYEYKYNSNPNYTYELYMYLFKYNNKIYLKYDFYIIITSLHP